MKIITYLHEQNAQPNEQPDNQLIERYINQNKQLLEKVQQLEGQIKELNDKIAIGKTIRFDQQDQINRMTVQLRKAGIEPERYPVESEAAAV